MPISQGKFKLGQNRSLEDQRSMRRHLEASPESQARDLAGFMREFGGLED